MCTLQSEGMEREGKGREGKEAVGEYIDTKKPKKNIKNIKPKKKTVLDCCGVFCIDGWISIDQSAGVRESIFTEQLSSLCTLKHSGAESSARGGRVHVPKHHENGMPALYIQ